MLMDKIRELDPIDLAIGAVLVAILLAIIIVLPALAIMAWKCALFGVGCC